MIKPYNGDPHIVAKKNLTNFRRAFVKLLAKYPDIRISNNEDTNTPYAWQWSKPEQSGHDIIHIKLPFRHHKKKEVT